MEAKSRFKVKLSNEAQEFLDGLPNKVREKIISNIRKSTFVLDPDLFKKLDDTDIWEFRTFYNKTKYRLLAFWDKDDKINTLVIACVAITRVFILSALSQKARSRVLVLL